jgi:predicted small lipoprotein YifL
VILIVKSPFVLLTSLALLSACGQTGPLYMPKAPPKAAPAPQTFTPPAPAAGVTPPLGGSNANNGDATTNQNAPTPQQ